MTRLLTICLLFGSIPNLLSAQCPAGQSQVIIEVVPDAYPSEISWNVASDGSTIAMGTFNDDTLCVTSGQCIQFNYFDSFGDGIFAPGYIAVYVDGVQVFFVNGTYDQGSVDINCPPGTSCNSPIAISQGGSYTAEGPDTWYTFTAPETGAYTFSTCNQSNTCNTIIYGYESCPPFLDEGALGVEFYNDDNCGQQSMVSHLMEAGDDILVRIGDNATSCAGQAINWSVTLVGGYPGCTDSTACNYNPVATDDDGSCWYPTASTPCNGPDLVPDHDYLQSSIYMDNNHNAWNCEVEEGCILGYGTRQMLKYGVQIWNYGNQPYWPGTWQNNPDAYEFAPCHNHYHYLGFAESYLYNANFEQVDFARKTSYAIINMTCQNPTSDPPLAAGCSDIYGAGYACQAVDVTDLDTGNYYLVLRLNAGHHPDYTGRIETDFDNNATQVCLHLGLLPNGDKTFTLLEDCDPYVDCAGVPLGNTSMDCAGDCGGSRIRGDLDLDTARTNDDFAMYMNQIAQENINPILCHQLTNDTTYTILDAARLNGCIRHMEGEHEHFGGGNGGTHSHCNFPFSVLNMLDTVHFGLTNPQPNSIDVLLDNPQSYVLGAEFRIGGITVDSVKLLASNFNPMITYNTNGHIAVLSTDEFPLNKDFNNALVRVYFSASESATICIDEVIDVVNSQSERVMSTVGECVYISGTANLPAQVGLNLFPNPAHDRLQVNIKGGLAEDAKVTMSDMTGRVVGTWFVNNSRDTFELEVSNMPDGVYFISLETPRFVGSERIVIRH